MPNSNDKNNLEISVAPSLAVSHPGNGDSDYIKDVLVKMGAVMSQSMSRQFTTVPKVMLDNGVPLYPLNNFLKLSYEAFAGGLPSRVVYTSTMGLAVTAKEAALKAKPDLDSLSQTGIAALTETVVGITPETLSNSKALGLSKDGKALKLLLNNPYAVARAAAAAAVPYFFRNDLGWVAPFFADSQESNQLQTKVFLGMATGFVGSIPDTIGNMMAKHAGSNETQSIMKAVSESFSYVMNDIYQDPAKFARTVKKGIPFRIAGNVGSAFIFSQGGTQAIGDLIDNVRDSILGFEAKESPPKSVKVAEANPVDKKGHEQQQSPQK